MTVEEFQQFSLKIAEHFQFTLEKLSDRVVALKATKDPSTDVLRIVFSESQPEFVGIAFHVEITGTDAIQIFSFCQSLDSNCKLLECYYEDSNGNIVNGLDAVIMMEHDRENHYLKILQNKTRAQQEEDFQVAKMQKAGKITWH